jgi:sugar phosphate isomerase/epimerase
MKNPLYFASSSKVWSSPDWVYGIEECGYDGWEISADGNYRLDNADAFAKILEIIETTRLAVSVHAPFTDLNIGSLNDPIYRESIRQMQLCITKAADITDTVTIHPGYVSPHGRLVPGKVWNLHKEALREIGATGIDTGVRVCLENMPKIPDFLCMEADEHYGMIEGVDGIYATVDLGHANTTGQVKTYLDRIGTATHMHIHDNHGSSDEHLALGGGTIDWEDAGRRISAAYTGICVVEGRNIEEAAVSRDVFRRCFS